MAEAWLCLEPYAAALAAVPPVETASTASSAAAPIPAELSAAGDAAVADRDWVWASLDLATASAVTVFVAAGDGGVG